jgi:dihydroorotate dehydrogenase (NAD+) catalytic subunit
LHRLIELRRSFAPVPPVRFCNVRLRRRKVISTTPLDLSVQVGSVSLPNPVMTAAGTAGHGAEFLPFAVERLGALVVKSIGAEPWAGNAAPRLRPVDAGMLNAVGLQNPGVQRWIAEDYPALQAASIRTVVSVWGFTVDDYHRTVAALAPLEGIVAIEVNVSCPNLEDRRHMFGHSTAGTAAVLGACREAAPNMALWAKLSPNVTDITEIAGAALAAGADALTLTNTVMGLVIDASTRRPALGNGGGGLSGPAIRPVAVRAVYECRKAFPAAAIIGVGGISRGEHAVEFLLAGANAVQVGTASFYDPKAPVRVLDELVDWCHGHGVKQISDLVSGAHT